jgi:ATP-dependent Clp protease ATP-binding subunit ClpC
MEHNGNLESAILTALSEASLYGVTELTDDILFYILYRDESYGIIKKTLYAASISSYELKTLLNTLYDMQPNAEKREVPYSQETLNTLAKAEEYAILTDSDILETPHVLLALLDSPNEILQNYYRDHNADLDALRRDLIEYIYTSNVSRLYTKDVRKSTTKQIPKPLKDQCEDLVQQALDGEIDPLIGREKEIEAIINTLSRRTKNNVLLLGDSGTGKTAIVKGLALKIANGEIPALANKKIFSLNLGSLMTNTTYR